jgi:hypothetical protein
MKRFATMALLVGLTVAGCMPLRPDNEKTKLPQTQMKTPAPQSAIMPEDVNDKNATEIPKRLQAEIEQDLKAMNRAPSSAALPE